MPKKICVVVASRANYARVKYVLKAIQNHPDLELQLIVGASTLLERFGKAVNVIKSDGFQPLRSIYYVVEGETLSTQAKSLGLGVIELSTAFEDLKPDMVITVADRFETMATAIAATYLNIPLVHIQGGEISGNIDERVRHAITKLADIHFPSTEQSSERIIRMGENPECVFNFGCPSIDILTHENLHISNSEMSKYGGVGVGIDWLKPYILIVQHPVTTSYGQGFQQVSVILNSVRKFTNIQKIVLWPNIDAGTDDVSKGIRIFREKNYHENFHYFRGFSPEAYAKVLNNAACCAGNSSSFIREGSFLGTPAVIVGDRQQNREHGHNAIFVDYNEDQIQSIIEKQINYGKYPSLNIFGTGDAGTKITAKLAEISTSEIIKKNCY